MDDVIKNFIDRQTIKPMRLKNEDYHIVPSQDAVNYFHIKPYSVDSTINLGKKVRIEKRK